MQRLVQFEPPEVTFGFSKELNYMLHPSPTVTLGVSFEFSARFKYGLVLDTKGIREAIMQKKPFKALNSFALMDKFDDVDEPLISITASVGFEVGVSAVIVKVSVGGSIRIQAIIDLYDPYPDTSDGLIRPYELLSISLNPFDWLEYELSMTLELSVSIQIGLFIGFFEVILYEYTKTWSIELVAGNTDVPDAPTQIVDCNADTNTMTLKDPGVEKLECTRLEGHLADENIECILDKPINGTDPIQSCQHVKRVTTESSESSNAIVLRDIESPIELNNFGALKQIELDYAKTKMMTQVIAIEKSKATVGSSTIEFESTESGILVTPKPELGSLTTSFSGGCDANWKIKGYTNLEVKASQIDPNCKINALQGVGKAKLVIDFRPKASATCSNGNHVIVTADSLLKYSVVRIAKVGGRDWNSEIKVGKNFREIELLMTDCSDNVDILKTSQFSGGIVVRTGAGTDVVRVGNGDIGLDSIFKNVFVYGGEGQDTLIVNDAGSQKKKAHAGMRSGSLTGMLSSPDDGASNPRCSLSSYEDKTFSVDSGSHW